MLCENSHLQAAGINDYNLVITDAVNTTSVLSLFAAGAGQQAVDLVRPVSLAFVNYTHKLATTRIAAAEKAGNGQQAL
ncbi:hypothetical protein TI39_contig324g00003 [Zymoseptoria brevis]|uniref:Uncharacterized protein n=1 Tax=Zymoseptoria brevis TaxID=1047168 RepID=A0A0F4GWD9_9PEZI|nr:hypothetical protein TI39_contig324g00003 [Zymoseptoria brevis]